MQCQLDELQSKPGDEFSYSNDGYNLLAAIIEISSGKSYEEYVQEAVLDPAGMSDTGFWPSTPEINIAPIAKAPEPEIAVAKAS